MVEKYVDQLEYSRKLFDYAMHNGSCYLNGHCFVSLGISIPVIYTNGKRYISFPITYRMWTKEYCKLDMTAEIVKNAMRFIGSHRRVILCCDSWYPKEAVVDFVDKFDNLTIIANVRGDTVLYELPPKRTGKRRQAEIQSQQRRNYHHTLLCDLNSLLLILQIHTQTLISDWIVCIIAGSVLHFLRLTVLYPISAVCDQPDKIHQPPSKTAAGRRDGIKRRILLRQAVHNIPGIAKEPVAPRLNALPCAGFR